MTDKTTEALKLAEEALEGWKEYDTWTDQQMWNDDDEEALAAIRKSLAEPVQEPVAWICEGKFYNTEQHSFRTNKKFPNQTPLYAAPVSTKREWVDLTVSDLDAIIEKHYDDEMDLKAMILDGIAALKEKNK